MNNPQKIVLGITVILIGCVLFMYIAYITNIIPSGLYVPEFPISSLFVVVLGVALFAVGLIILFGIKKR